MTYCKYCGQPVPESEGTVCEYCKEKEESEESELPNPLLLAPPKNKGSNRSLMTITILSLAVGVILFFFLLGKRILI
jgi:uncharacterized membrane protein YvbJ